MFKDESGDSQVTPILENPGLVETDVEKEEGYDPYNSAGSFQPPSEKWSAAYAA